MGPSVADPTSSGDTRQAPRPDEFGLLPDLTLAQAEAQIVKHNQQATLRSLLVFVCLIVPAGFVSLSAWGSGWTWIICVVTAMFYLANVNDFVRGRYLDTNAFELMTFVRETKQWIEFNTEQGFGYWRDQRGRQFEESVAKFFRRRGWKASLTRTTGDGGIDVILGRGSASYWCQCKGHAKPISVAEIRRIAGATIKSNGAAKPVIISTNGFTRPALDEARELGVICLDGMRLSQLAYKSEIIDLT